MSKNMERLYEKAWNETVRGLSDYKKNIVINNFPYESRPDMDIANEVARTASRLAERWEKEEVQILSGQL